MARRLSKQVEAIYPGLGASSALIQVHGAMGVRIGDRWFLYELLSMCSIL